MTKSALITRSDGVGEGRIQEEDGDSSMVGVLMRIADGKLGDIEYLSVNGVHTIICIYTRR